MRTAFEREGDIRSVDLTGAFAALWQERATGVLAFARGQERVRFEILEGELVGVFSSDSSFDTAEVLIRGGKLDGAALEGRPFPPGRDRARAARELGVLTERDWRWGEKIRAVEILSDLIGWLAGRYSFDPGERPEPGDFRLGIERLLLELFLRSRDREFVHRSLGAVDAPLQRADDFEDRFRRLGLTADAELVVAVIDGRATAAEISRRVGPDPFSVEKLLAALTTLGLVHPEYAAPLKPKWSGPAKVAPAPPPAPVAEPEPPGPAPETPAPDATSEPEAVAPTPPLESSSNDVEPPPEPKALEEPVLEREPVELPLGSVPEPSDAEPVLTSWEPIPPEPLDQAFALPEPPALRQTSRPGLSAIWLLLVLAVAVAALLVSRSRHRGPAARTSGIAASPTAVPTGSAAAVAALPPAPMAAVTSVAERPTGIPAMPSPSTTARRVPTAIPPTASAAIAVPSETASRDRRRWTDRAQRDLRTVRRDQRKGYAIQVELVCELASLDEAWRYDRRGTLWLLTADYRGRECFRVFWGRYATMEEARAAKASVPRFFFTPTNQPAIVSTRALLP
jgi:Domain of unknown function (DUF4388)